MKLINSSISVNNLKGATARNAHGTESKCMDLVLDITSSGKIEPLLQVLRYDAEGELMFDEGLIGLPFSSLDDWTISLNPNG